MYLTDGLCLSTSVRASARTLLLRAAVLPPNACVPLTAFRFYFVLFLLLFLFSFAGIAPDYSA